MVSSFDTLQSNGQVIFSNRMIIREVESNFAATIGVYCMVTNFILRLNTEEFYHIEQKIILV
jgi:hypothetical protein